MSKVKTIGIIGGQGPLSTADFYMRIIHYYQEKFNVKMLENFPPIIIYSVPSPDLISGVENEELTLQSVSTAIKKLERDGCDFIVIVCNSLHYLLDKFQAHVKIPIISITEVVSNHLKEESYTTVGLLATQTTVSKRVYEKDLASAGISYITPALEDQKKVEQIILNEERGKITDDDRQELISIMTRLLEKGAETILLACTELPVLINQNDTDIPLVDCNEIFATAAAKYSYFE